MKRTIRFFLALVALATCNGAWAQNLNGAYFMEGWAYGHELNPALDYDRRGYISIPFLPSNMNVGVRGNLNLKDVLYKNPNGGGLVTYLHSGISNAEALSGFSSNNKLLQDLRYDIFSFGFRACGGYNTFTVGLRENAGAHLPYEFFDLTKNLQNKDYSLSDLGATASAWMEVGLGHSHQINDAWRIGAKAKLLLGVGYARLQMNSLDLNLSGDNKWTATADATGEVGLKGFSWGEKTTTNYNTRKNPDGTPATYEQIDLDNLDIDSKKTGIAGMGFAVDLGAEWDLGKQGLVDGLKLSAALLDLGFINWKDVAVARNSGEAFEFDGFDDVQATGGNGVADDDQTGNLGDRLSELYSLQDGGTSSKCQMLGATLNLAAQYKLPCYDRFRVGLLSTTRIQGVYSWNEERLSANYSPCKWFEMGVNAAVGTVGASLGWIINLHPNGFSLFMGSDHSLFKLSKQYIPQRSCADFSMGINFPLGKSRVVHGSRK